MDRITELQSLLDQMGALLFNQFVLLSPNTAIQFGIQTKDNQLSASTPHQTSGSSSISNPNQMNDPLLSSDASSQAVRLSESQINQMVKEILSHSKLIEAYIEKLPAPEMVQNSQLQLETIKRLEAQNLSLEEEILSCTSSIEQRLGQVKSFLTEIAHDQMECASSAQQISNLEKPN